MSPEDPAAEGGVAADPAAEQIVAAFARMSGLFLNRATIDTALSLVTALAAEMVPHTAGAGITLVDAAGKRSTAAATSAVVERADALQYRLGAGPCLTAWADRVVVRIDDTAADRRWPVWARSAADLGLAASLSAPLVSGGRALGALKVYATAPRGYGQREEHVLTMFSAQAAMLLAHLDAAADAERLSSRIAESLTAREVITLAKGIVMARDGVDERAAFLTLAHSAQQQRLTLREAAERLTASTVRRRR